MLCECRKLVFNVPLSEGESRLDLLQATEKVLYGEARRLGMLDDGLFTLMTHEDVLELNFKFGGVHGNPM